MTKEEVLVETVNRLYCNQSCKPLGGKRTREEDWLESLIRILADLPEDAEIKVDLAMLQSDDILTKLKNM